MAKRSIPAKLWDHYLELKGYICSHTGIDIYKLDGQVPETLISGQTADISPFVEYHFYDWIKYWDSLEAYPEPKECLGCWLSPAMDVGPAMTTKILKDNGQVAYVSTYHFLTTEEYHKNNEVQL